MRRALVAILANPAPLANKLAAHQLFDVRRHAKAQGLQVLVIRAHAVYVIIHGGEAVIRRHRYPVLRFGQRLAVFCHCQCVAHVVL